jgi:RNA polymerase sigma-70 factor, ECF subfamily
VSQIAGGEDFPGRAGRDPASAGALVTDGFLSVQPDLIRYLRAVVGREVAEDVASQVWVEVVAGAASFRGDQAAFRRWLFTTARRRGLDHRRRWWQRSVVLRPPGAYDLDQPVVDDASSGEEAAALAQIRRLPAAEAEVVLLRVLAGFSAQEVADITGRSAGSVRVIQHRALRRLGRMLGPNADADPNL